MPKDPAARDSDETRVVEPRWNAGGWFGGQLGGTVWLLLLGILLLGIDVVAAVGVLLCFAGANAIGSWLWSRRERLALHPAIMGMMAACGLAALLAMLLLDSRGASAPLGSPTPYWTLLIYPGVMLMVHLQHRSRTPR